MGPMRLQRRKGFKYRNLVWNRAKRYNWDLWDSKMLRDRDNHFLGIRDFDLPDDIDRTPCCVME